MARSTLYILVTSGEESDNIPESEESEEETDFEDVSIIDDVADSADYPSKYRYKPDEDM